MRVYRSAFNQPSGGLPAFSHLLKSARLPWLFGPCVKTIPDAAMFTTQIALLALGKTGFEAVSACREDRAFGRLLGVKRVPSAEILRQHIDGARADLHGKLAEASLRVLQAHGKPWANYQGFVPLDIDSTPMDNSATSALMRLADHQAPAKVCAEPPCLQSGK